MILAQGQIQDTYQPIIFVPPNSKLTLQSIFLFNKGEQTTKLRFYAVPNDNGSLGQCGEEHAFVEIDLTAAQVFEFTTAGLFEYENHNDAFFAKGDFANNVNYIINGRIS